MKDRKYSKETRDSLTPELALKILLEGNERFVSNIKEHRDLLEQINETADGQFPFAAILSCIDSRTSAELIFDQGLGDIFSIRIAGNIINDDILGSMEYACKVAGSKLILVLGHTKCGAIQGACDNIELGHITTLLEKVKPAIKQETSTTENRNGQNNEFVERVASINVFHSVDQIRKQSILLAEMEKKNQIKIAGALYDLDTGVVTFYH